MASTENIRSFRPMSAATKLRRTIEDPKGFVFAPGVYDGFSARTALEVGFDCLYMVSIPYHLGGKYETNVTEIG
jgi:2-methylisocitrate lyase-like PEP mutase family enzyme